MAVDHRQPKERWALVGLAALAVFACSYAIVKGLRRPTPIAFHTFGESAANASTGSPIHPSAQVLVHAAGAVKHPGLVRLAEGARVNDAIAAAGGALADADLDGLNLAAKVLDGTQIFVPHKASPPGSASPSPAQKDKTRPAQPKSEIVKSGQIPAEYQGGTIAPPYQIHIEPDQPAPAGGGQPAQPTGGSTHRTSTKKAPTGPVHLNSATSSELQTLPGIGPATAQKIIDYRTAHNGFRTIEELIAVKGIGEKKMAALRKWLQL